MNDQKEKIFCLRKHRDEFRDKFYKLEYVYELKMSQNKEHFANIEKENDDLKGKLADLKEELTYKNQELEKLQEKSINTKITSSSLENELEKAIIASKTTKRLQLLKKIGDLEEKRKEEIKNLKDGIEKLKIRRMRPKCKYGWNCEKAFCRFDHKYLYTLVNNTNTNLICDVCGKTFQCKKNLVDHAGSCINTQSPEKIVLNQRSVDEKRDKCNKSNKSRKNLRKHEEKGHQINILHYEKCDKTFVDKYQLKEHNCLEKSRTCSDTNIRIKKKVNKIGNAAKKNSNMKKVKSKHEPKKSKMLLVDKTADKIELDDVDSSDCDIEDDVSTGDETTEVSDSENSETESGEIDLDSEDSC